MRRLRERGDTIVETIIAFAVFSSVVVGTMAVMNRGVAMAQRSLEVTLTRQQIDGQGEMIRYIRDNMRPTWLALISPAKIETNPAPLTTNNATCASPTARAFFVRGMQNADPVIVPAGSANYTQPTTYPQIDNAASISRGVWVEATRAEGGAVSAYDFRIHACWQSTGSDIPVSLGTIVRLYAD